MKRIPKMNAVTTQASGAALTPEMFERFRQAVLRGEHRSRVEAAMPVCPWLAEPVSKGAKKK